MPGLKLWKKSNFRRDEYDVAQQEQQNPQRRNYAGKRRSASELRILESTKISKIQKFLKGVDPDDIYDWDFHYWEPIHIVHYVAAKGTVDAVKALYSLFTKKVVNKKTPTGLHAMHFAVKYRNEQVIVLLSDFGENINARDKDRGQTPIHMACERKNTDAVKILLSLGAKLDIMDKQRQTPMDIANNIGYGPITKCFEKEIRDTQFQREIQALPANVKQNTSRIDVLESKQGTTEERLHSLERYVHGMGQYLTMGSTATEGGPPRHRYIQHHRAYQTMGSISTDGIPLRAKSCDNLTMMQHVQWGDPVMANQNVNMVNRRQSLTRKYSRSDSGYGGSTHNINHGLGLNNEKDKLQRCFPLICDNMNPEEVVGKLFAASILNFHHKQEIDQLKQPREKNKVVFDQVFVNPSQCFQIFIAALRDTGQNQLAEAILKSEEGDHIYGGAFE